MAVDTVNLLGPYAGNETIIDAINVGLDSCLTMCGMKARCIGLSSLPIGEQGKVTGIIGIHGNVSGFITINLSDKMAMKTVGGFLQEELTEIGSQVVDGVGEMANLLSGGIKKALAGTDWGFSHVTVPSVIVGHSYHVAHCAGMNYISAVFEFNEEDTLMVEDRLMQVTMSMIRLSS